MKEALKLALEALKKTQSEGYNLPSMAISEAILVAEAVLAQPEQSTTCGEPVAWQVEMFIDGVWVSLGNPQKNKTRAEALASNPSLPKEHQRIFPLYTTPPQPDQKIVGTVGDLFDERVISKLELDRDFLVYTTPPKENT